MRRYPKEGYFLKLSFTPVEILVLVLLEDTTGVRYSNPAEFQQDLSI